VATWTYMDIVSSALMQSIAGPYITYEVKILCAWPWADHDYDRGLDESVKECDNHRSTTRTSQLCLVSVRMRLISKFEVRFSHSVVAGLEIRDTEVLQF
jgi:hypothetical protein